MNTLAAFKMEHGHPQVEYLQGGTIVKGRTELGGDFARRPRSTGCQWAQRDLNPRPSDYESAALTA